MSGKKKQTSKEEIVALETNYGTLKVKLYNETPKHKANFLNLVDSGYYDGLLFHRVIPKFMIQAGDPDSRNAKPNKNLGNNGPGYTIEAEIIDTFIHKYGALAAARTSDEVNPEKRSSGSQFYIVKGRKYTDGEMKRVTDNLIQQRKMAALKRFLYDPKNEALLRRAQSYQGGRMMVKYDSLIRSIEPQVREQLGTDSIVKFTEYQKRTYTTLGGVPHLDGGYTVFGELVEGFDVLDSISGAERNHYDRPKKDVIILRATRVKK